MPSKGYKPARPDISTIAPQAYLHDLQQDWKSNPGIRTRNVWRCLSKDFQEGQLSSCRNLQTEVEHFRSVKLNIRQCFCNSSRQLM
jgi:hypothetical protein